MQPVVHLVDLRSAFLVTLICSTCCVLGARLVILLVVFVALLSAIF